MDYQTQKLKLLYVEDADDVREATILFFEEFFTDIETASNGEEGLKKYRKINPDIIITDINMPVMSGIDMIKKIREKDKEIPIVVISAYSDVEYFIDCIRYGVDGYILKPIDLEQFTEVLDKVLEKIFLKRQLEETIFTLRQYQKAIDELYIVSKTDPKGILTYVNNKFSEISKYSKEELIGKPHNIVRHPDLPKSFFENLWKTIKEEKKIWKGIIKNRAKDGSTYYVDTVIAPILDVDGNIKEFLSVRNDVTEIMSPKKKLESLIDHSKEFIVAIINIDNFKYIEKIYDFSFIQKVENKIIDLISESIPDECNFKEIFNLGEGEFVIAKELTDNKDEIIKKAIKNLKSLQEKLTNNSEQILDYQLEVSISLAYGKDAYRNAKYGLSKLEKLGTDFVVANELEEKITEEAKHNLKILKLLKSSIEKNKIISFFQPIIDNSTKNVVKYESLIRIIDDQGKIVSPFYFLEIAKRTKYYTDLTLFVIKYSIGAIDKLNTEVSINISMIDIEKDSIRENIISILKDNKDKASKITFEILEEENVKDFSLVKDFLQTVKSFGVKIAIDDFGKGYSNFERLLEYSPDILKIDGSLVKNIETGRFSLNLVETLVSFAKRQNLKTIAEFVENENIYKILQEIGVDCSQGYYFGKPEPLDRIIKKVSV